MFITLVGITVTDVWKLCGYHGFYNNVKDLDGNVIMGIKKFTGILAKQLLNIARASDDEETSQLQIRNLTLPSTICVSSKTTDESDLTSCNHSKQGIECLIYADTSGVLHYPELLPMKTQPSGKKYRSQRHCH